MWCQRRSRLLSEDDTSESSDSILPSDEPPSSPVRLDDLPVHPDSEDMNCQDIWEIFDIRVERQPFFPVPRSNLLPLPKDLESELDKLTTCHDRLNTLLKYCIRAEKKARRGDKTSTDHLGHHFSFTRGGHLQLTAKNRRKTKEIVGQADYCIWQGDESTSSGLVITGTEDQRDISIVKLRCFAYMSISRSLREKTPTIVYGVVTDGRDFQFMSIDSSGRFNDWRPCTMWDERAAPAIYTTLRLALQHPATPPCIPALTLKMKREDNVIRSSDTYHGLFTD